MASIWRVKHFHGLVNKVEEQINEFIGSEEVNQIKTIHINPIIIISRPYNPNMEYTNAYVVYEPLDY